MPETKQKTSFSDGLSSQIAATLVRWHALFFAFGVLAVFVSVVGLFRVQASTDSRAFFDKSNPDFHTLLEVEDIYVSSEQTLVVISAPEGKSYDPKTLEVLRDATERAWSLSYVLRVDSVANYNYTYALADDIIVEPLLPQSGVISVDVANEARARIARTGDLINRLVSEDGRNFGIVIGQVPPDREAELFESIQSELHAFRDEILAELPDHEVFVTGSISGSLAFALAGKRDLREILPLAAAVTVLFLVIGLGSVSGVVGSVAVMFGGALLTLGAGGWMGMALTPGNSSSPLAVIVLIAATCMHLVLIWRKALQDGFDRKEAVMHSWEENLAPITVTNFTTAFGFLCLNFSDAPPLRDLGNMIAAGVIGGWILSLVLLPAILIWLPASNRKTSQIVPTALIKLVTWAFAHERLVILVFGVASIASVLGIVRIQFNDDYIKYFDETYELRRDTDQIETRLTPLDVLQFSFKSNSPAGVFDPEFLGTIEDFSTWLEDQPEVFKVNSIVPLLKRLNQNMNRDNAEYYRLAETSDANAQLMLLYELSLPVGHDLNSQISVDRDQALMSISVNVKSSGELRDFTSNAEDWLARNAPDIATKATGIPIIFARISYRNGRAMLLGTAVVLVVISGAMMVALRDTRFGMLSLVPNFVPAILAFGLWGLILRDVNLGSTVVTVMTFGIVVDDTVHLMMTYKRFRRKGNECHEALRLTMANVGTAIAFTTMMITAGFTVVAMSSFALNQHLGALTALVVATAFFADVILLPVLISKAERFSS